VGGARFIGGQAGAKGKVGRGGGECTDRGRGLHHGSRGFLGGGEREKVHKMRCGNRGEKELEEACHCEVTRKQLGNVEGVPKNPKISGLPLTSPDHLWGHSIRQDLMPAALGRTKKNAQEGKKRQGGVELWARGSNWYGAKAKRPKSPWGEYSELFLKGKVKECP